MANLQIIDESGDHKYFTIIPNFVLNHSTANDQATYAQMKRVAGEGGEFSGSEKFLMNQLGIGRIALKKSLKYLLDHKWITYKGKRKVITRGGTQEVNVYTVNDLWKMNADYFSKGVSRTAPLEENKGEIGKKSVKTEGKNQSENAQGVAEIAPLGITGGEVGGKLQKGVAENDQRGVQNSTQGVAETATKKNPIKKINTKKEENPKFIFDLEKIKNAKAALAAKMTMASEKVKEDVRCEVYDEERQYQPR
jgi:hypothetical protein